VPVLTLTLAAQPSGKDGSAGIALFEYTIVESVDSNVGIALTCKI